MQPIEIDVWSVCIKNPFVWRNGKMNGIQPGQVVRLKSGGPLMSVEDINNVNGVAKAWCQWFEDNKAQHGTFPVTSLEPAKP